jgi:hypothetical protein
MEKINLGIKANPTSMALTIPNIATFIITEHDIIVQPITKTDKAGIQNYLYTTALPYWLLRSGKTVLKGSVTTENKKTSKIFLGNCPPQKNTLLSDSWVVLTESDQKIVALPGFPTKKIWKIEAQRKHINLDDLHKVRPKIHRYYQSISDHFCDTILPVASLHVHNRYPLKKDPPNLKIKGMEKLKMILAYQLNPELQKLWKQTSKSNALLLKLASQCDVFKTILAEEDPSASTLQPATATL